MKEEDVIKEMAGTPIEKMKLEADALIQFKTTTGFKILTEYVREQQANLMRALIDGDDDIDLKQLRADMKAWSNLLGAVDKKIESYDIWLKQTLDIKKQQEQNMMRGLNNGR